MMARLLLTSAFILLAMGLLAQAPQGINYQGIARDQDGKPVASRTISIRASILSNGPQGNVEYAEVHEVTTNQFGLFTIVIGQGEPSKSTFNYVSWAVGGKWLEIEMDVNGGRNFQLLGSQQLMSVPYALYAQYANSNLQAGSGIAITDNVISNTGDGDNSATNELISNATLSSDHKLQITEGGNVQEVDLSGLLGASQDLSNVLSQGNSAGNQTIQDLAAPANANDAATKGYVDAHTDGDASATNEIQDLSLTGNTLKITNNAAATGINLSGYLDNTDNQDLSRNGNSLTLTGDATPVDLTPYLDNTDSQDLTLNTTTNELSLTGDPTTVNLSPYKQTLSSASVDANTRSVTISNGNTANVDVRDADASATNEAQTLTKAGAVVTLSNVSGTGGGSFTLNDDSNTNEIQNLSSVLTQGTDAGTKKITNLGAPTANADATTKQYVDYNDGLLAAKISTTYAFKTNFDYVNSSGVVQNNVSIPFTTEDFDDFSVLGGNTFSAAEDGTYVFMVEGYYNTLAAGGQLSLLFNSTKYAITIVQPFGATVPRYSAMFMFKLTAGQTVSLVGDSVVIGSEFVGRFFGFKL